jgi:hypothetical protein
MTRRRRATASLSCREIWPSPSVAAVPCVAGDASTIEVIDQTHRSSGGPCAVASTD